MHRSGAGVSVSPISLGESFHERSVWPMSRGAGALQGRMKCFHGLTYDPWSRTGCVLCRKAQAGGSEPGAAKPRRFTLPGMTKATLGALLILALPFISVRCYFGNRAEVGEPCGQDTGCVREAAGCIVPVPNESNIPGVCAERCSESGDCGEGQRCEVIDGISACLAAAPLGGSCDFKTRCAPGAGCISTGNQAPVCREKCDLRCPAGLTCTVVGNTPGWAFCLARE